VNAFDLCRLHLYGELDKEVPANTPINERPSYLAMVKFAREQPEIKALETADFADLGPLTLEVVVPAPTVALPAGGLAQPLAMKLANPTVPKWLLPDLLEEGVIAVMAGQRGSYKSFLSLDWAMRVATEGSPVYVISAEGGDFDRRATAWLSHHAPDTEPEDVPLFVAERRMDLNTHDGIELIRQDCLRLGIRPKLFVLDTYSKLSGGLDENSNTEVKEFLGRLANGLQRPDTGFGATVLLIAHTGHTETGRPRGASALGADSDAEYVVTRLPEGGVLLTRERFKASPELPALTFQPRSVPLDREDADGRPLTSLVMVPAEDGARPVSVRIRGVVQKMVYEFVRQKGAELDDGEVIRAVADRLTRRDGERDRRPERVSRAIEAMVETELLHRPRNGRLSISRAVRVEDGGEQWLE